MKGSITITNHTDDDIEVEVGSDQENTDPTRKVKINKKDYFVFMVDRVSSVSWEKTK